MSEIIDFFKNMTWEKFLSLLSKWYVIVFLLCFLTILVFFIITLSLNRKKDHKVMMQKNLNIVRLFSIHYKENYVYSIDKFDFRRKRKESLDWFYNSFTPQDKLRVVVWLSELQKEDHKVPHHLELHVKVKNIKQPIFCVISVSSINYEEGIIHIESRLFPNIKKNSRSKKKHIDTITHYKDLPDVLALHPLSPKSVFLIKLYSTNELDDEQSSVNHLIITLIISHLARYCSDTRKICLLNSNEILVVDFKITTKNEAYALSHTLSNEISKILFLSSIYDDYEYRIGIVQTRECSINLAEEIRLAREMSIYARSDESNSNAAIYDENLNLQNDNQSSIIKNIRNYMDRRLFSCKYVPILNTYDGSIFGYHCELYAPGALLNSIEDMQEYAIRNNFLTELNRILYLETNQVFNFNTNLNRFVYTTLGLKPSQYLSFIDLYTHSETPNQVKTIFIIEDSDLVEDQQRALEIIKELKKNGMCLGLRITSTNLDLIPDIMKIFDFFFLGEESFKNAYEAQQQILYGDMLTRLSFYSAQIISTNISSWPLIDFACRNSIKHVSSSLFGVDSKQLPIIDNKKLNKFNNIAKHY